jgi:hypothetical protein
MRERMIEDWIIETPFMVRGREGEKRVLATSEFVDRGSCHAAKCKATRAVGLAHSGVSLTNAREVAASDGRADLGTADLRLIYRDPVRALIVAWVAARRSMLR